MERDSNVSVFNFGVEFSRGSIVGMIPCYYEGFVVIPCKNFSMVIVLKTFLKPIPMNISRS